ncbi:hypothetical protein [Streptomyces scabiei]|uniref:hypothetical protein n=1 Tax=Streptomyces scabiei TaxID=1930 RepID=UPI0029AD99F3|nr:hypothetical protein [Streptomyces scabiei]MDX2540142.1 hypothetical protein [Streptomyces scabiei]MDX2802559.1 hypothetical protein [Streptomyces scabiei]MDX2858995.1 hypothetical protein [Streptomyces scabiei]MDX3830588.1 hypothetical protein [Streptomyces scabiei]
MAAGVVLTAAARVYDAGALVVPSGLLMGCAYAVVKPWFVARSEICHRVITFVPMVLHVLLLGGVVILAADGLPDDPVPAGLALMGVWIFHVFCGVPEPTGFAYERLAGRLTWAVALQVFSMACGTAGIALCLTRGLPVPARFEPVVVGTSLGLVVAMCTASLKVFSRGRRLATRLAGDARRMARCLERLSRGGAMELSQLQESAEDAWDALELTLRSKIETGFHLSGTFVIPDDERRSLEGAVAEAIAAPDSRSYEEAVARLTMLRTACRDKIDVAA